MEKKSLPETKEKGKWIVFALCLLIIFESVVIVKSLEGGREEKKESQKGEILEELVQKEKAEFYFDGPSSWKKGETNELALVLVPLKSFNLDGVDLVFSYDPEKVRIEAVEPTDLFDTQARVLIQPEEKRVVVSLLELSRKEGVRFNSGEEVVLLRFKLTPLLEKGEETVIFLKGEKGTNLVEAGTGKRLDFKSENYYLEVKE